MNPATMVRGRSLLVAGLATLLLASDLPLGPQRPAAGAPALIVQTEQVARGREIFALQCSRCHGDQGQGTEDGPRLVGPGNGLHGYQTAQKLFEFVRSEMPATAPGSLQAQEYWDVLAFLLDANRLLPPGTTLGPENAPDLRLDR